ncbi:hypothetical protein M0805_005536 [Coniferiporia weirii]|nr:hypothetical protein M0805_005536 [Coniferiporia weirii]
MPPPRNTGSFEAMLEEYGLENYRDDSAGYLNSDLIPGQDADFGRFDDTQDTNFYANDNNDYQAVPYNYFSVPFDCLDAQEPAMPTNATAATRRQVISRPFINQNHIVEDEIDDFSSSDTHGYDVSSPTPSYRRDNSSASLPRLGGRSSRFQHNSAQQNYSNNGADHAYTQGIIGSQRAPESILPTSQKNTRGSNPRNAHNLRLRPVSELPDIYRGMFKFGVFNAVQSKCFDTIMQTRENMVISAPTSSGKTVLFELSLIEMLMASGHQSPHKCVYVAPTKALCSERTRDWTAKFDPLGIKCYEMTGDTVETRKFAWLEAKKAKIIITTSEKWDSLTRSWHDHGEFLSEIKLFLVDEVHILNESRGSTLEVVVSRMKTRGLGIRFLLVSATVPNIRDVANWIGNSSLGSEASATVFEFGEEYRPCKITRHVYGYPRKNQNDFQFTRMLDFKLYSVLQQHACGKPILIFCNTRKGVLSTAEQLLKDYEQTVSNRQNAPWTQPRQLNQTFDDKRLEKLVKSGIGVHHAGLSLDDRREMESLFLDGSLRIVTATSTLAVGVNLPAHTVVIKGVKLYQNNAWQEYSDLDIVQMIGRAGRPQFDKEGVAIILCEQELERKYKNLAQGTTVLESSLHQNLSEHVNSEIGIGTITNVQSAKGWLKNTFLRQRIQRNPAHYHIGKSAEQTWEERLDDMVLQSIKKLKASELIATEGEEETAELSVTKYGDIMSKYYVRQTTMGSIVKLPERPSIREIVYNKMRDHPKIRYKIKKVEKASDKAFILIQAVLGGIPLSAPEYKTSDSQPTLDALSVFRHTARIARVVVEVAIVKKNGAQLKHGLELVRCLTAKAWEDRPVVLRQIESIGEKSLKVLAEHGITSFQILQKQDPTRIELLLNRRPPFGHEVLAFVRNLPQYDLTVKVDDITSYNAKKPVSVELTIECRALQPSIVKAKSKQRSRSLGMTSILTTTSDLDFVDFRRIATKALINPRSFSVTAELSKPSQSVCVFVSSENFAGINVMQSYKPSISAREYPTMNTHPKTAEEMLLDGLEDDPDFWNNTLDDDEVEKLGMKNPTSEPLDAKPSREKPQPANSASALLDALDETSSKNPLEPRRLSNGNYACNHTCRDKQKCRHFCCREGTAKPAPVPRKLASEPKKGIHTVSAQGVFEPQKKRPVPKREMEEDRRLKQLESLHKRTGVNNSLRLPEGQRIKLDDNVKMPHKQKQGASVNFDLELADIRDEDERDDESIDEMPGPKELLTTTRRNQRAKDEKSSETDYSNSELDAIMLTVDTENLPTSLTVSGGAGQPHSPPPDGNSGIGAHNKRKIMCDDSQSCTSTMACSQSAAKKSKLFSDSRTISDDDPLFLHDSTLSSSSALSPHHTLGNAGHNPSDTYDDDTFLDLDETMFDVLTPYKASSTAQVAYRGNDSNNSAVDFPKGSLEGGRQGVETSGTFHYEERECDVTGEDDWADFEDWLENSGSVRIIENLDI